MKQEDMDVWNEVIKTVTPLGQTEKLPLLKRLFPRRFFYFSRPPLSTRLDLHQFTLQEAFDAFNGFINEHGVLGTRSVLVVTGKGADGKGLLRKEFPLWTERAGIREKIQRIEQAPPHMGGEGAFLVYLKRKK